MFRRSLYILILMTSAASAQESAKDLRETASRSLKKAITYYHDTVSSHGGYVYYVSLDLKRRWGEGEVTKDTIFVQPPGTPTVGMALLKAHAATGEPAYLGAATDAANALVYGQLKSGGWTQVIHFAKPERGRLGAYRGGGGGSWNVSSLDDGQTQSALQFLLRADKAHDFKNAAIHSAATGGVDALLKAQFASGGFPQVWTGPVERKPVRPARLPERDWKTEGKIKDYWNFPTLNDGLAGLVADTLIVAHEITKDDRCLAALAKLGDFLILAQMPEPQPAWCQQYNDDMEPMWARKFEPPAIAGLESQDVMETLIRIARVTGDKKYLEPIPRALKYLTKSLLNDGQLARFYELESNRPLYMDASYKLSYDPSAAPAHYGWKHPSRLDRIEAALIAAKAGEALPPPAPPREDQVRKILADLDPDGRWISTYAGERLVGQPKFENGFRYLSSEVFSRNVEALSDFLAAAGK